MKLPFNPVTGAIIGVIIVAAIIFAWSALVGG